MTLTTSLWPDLAHPSRFEGLSTRVRAIHGAGYAVVALSRVSDWLAGRKKQAVVAQRDHHVFVDRDDKANPMCNLAKPNRFLAAIVGYDGCRIHRLNSESIDRAFCPQITR